jgi:hypothetical protein
MPNFKELIASWRQLAKGEKAKAVECEDEGCSIWSSLHSGREFALLSCANELEKILLSEEKKE